MRTVLALTLVLALTTPAEAGDVQTILAPDTVVVENAGLQLKALLWRPPGPGPFPAVLFNHGSGRATTSPVGRQDQLQRVHQAETLGPVFASHGYAFLFLFRRGVGPSAGQGTYSGDLMDRELSIKGQEGRNRIQLQLLETDELSDALAGLAFLRALHGIDGRRIAVAGHSFGGSLTLLVAERDPDLRAAIDFAGAANSWEPSPPLQKRLLRAVEKAAMPIFFLHAANDYSVKPGTTLSAKMARLGKAHRLKIYPPVGKTASEGHSFIYSDVKLWESDVFAFLDERMISAGTR